MGRHEADSRIKKALAVTGSAVAVAGILYATTAFGASNNSMQSYGMITCTTNSSGVCSYDFLDSFGVAPDSVLLTPRLTSSAAAYSVASVAGSVTTDGGQARASVGSAPLQNTVITFYYEALGEAPNGSAPTSSSAPTTNPPTTTVPPTTAPPTTTAPPSRTPPPTTPPPSNPPQTGWPNASNTGVPAGTSLTNSGSITASTAGQVISGKNISGHVDIRAANVVIKDSKIAAGSSTYAIQVFSGSVSVEDTTITGSNGFAIGYDNWTGLRLNVSGVGQDGFKGGNGTTLEDSYVHDFSPSSGAHADGIQFEGGGSNAVIRHNSIDPHSGGDYGNSAVFLKDDLGGNSPGPITVTDNLLGGGNYTLYCVPGNGGNQTGVHVTDNRFLRDHQYGPVDVSTGIAEWSGNVYDDNGQTVSQ